MKYHCKILDEAIGEEVTLASYLKEMNKSGFICEEQEKSKLEKPAILVSPLIPILIKYDKKGNQKIDCNPVILMKKEKLQLRLCRQEEVGDYNYSVFCIENCECFSNLLTLQLAIQLKSQQKIESLSQLSTSFLRRTAVFNQDKIKIKKSLIIIEPIQTLYRYNPKQGYIYMKLDNIERTQKTINILSINIMNWVCNREEIGKYIVKSTMEDVVQIKAEQSYAVVFKVPTNMKGLKIPYNIIYSMENDKMEFKMIKYMRV